MFGESMGLRGRLAGPRVVSADRRGVRWLVALSAAATLLFASAGAASAADRAYWSDSAPTGAIRVGNLDGSVSPANLGTSYASESAPAGVAIDPAAGKIYWADGSAPGAIRVGNLDGSGTPQNLGTNYTTESSPAGVAIDPAAGKIYWTNFGSSGAIRVGNLDGGGAPQNLGASYASEDHPGFVALLRAPVAAGAPQLSGGSTAGSTLSCSQGSWAADLLGAFLYHAPRTRCPAERSL